MTAEELDRVKEIWGKQMNYDPKRENLLNLALDATPEEREKSLELGVGYEPLEQTWEVIVKHSGSLDALGEAYPRMQIVQLSNEYAVITLPQELIEALTNRTEIEYIEKPKRLFFAVDQAIRASCITPLYGEEFGLSGKNCLVCIVDSGIDYLHPDFINADGTTRIAYLWDQTLRAAGENDAPPEGFLTGVEFDADRINHALRQNSVQEARAICPSVDVSGHGTHVAGIAAGNGRASEGRFRGVAYEAALVVVKLGTPRENSFPRTTELMQAVDYVIRKARSMELPAAVNISIGNNYGSHDGTSLLETYLSDISNYWKTVIVTGTGNEGAARIHTSGELTPPVPAVAEEELLIADYETTMNLQIWKSYADTIGISIIHPNGREIGIIRERQGVQRFTLGETELLVYFGEPSPYSPYQEIYVDFLPVRNYIDSGIWTIRLTGERLAYGKYNMWLPSAVVLNSETGFLNPTEEITLTIPSTAEKLIAVGAYDSNYDQYASFSGRGYTRQTNQIKPDLAAPGVDIVSAMPGGGYVSRSGTSMAAPFVTGSAALLMEWGIINGNDPYLYGEKVKAYLIRGARRLRGYNEWPNRQMGWGALCVRDSLPV